jgi:hypothetical protein
LGLFTASALNNGGNPGGVLVSARGEGFAALGLLLGGVAVLGPVVYAALAFENGMGTYAGLFAAGIATMTSSLGILAEIGLGANYSFLPSRQAAVVYIGLGIIAVAVGIYGVRGLHGMAVKKPNSRSSLTANSAETSGTL